MTTLRGVLTDPRAVELLATVGTPYWWGKGDPRTPWPSDAYDCSGFAQGALVYLRQLRSSEPDRNARALADVCDPVQTSRVLLGDLVFYGPGVTHVMVSLGGDWVVGASGGGSNTRGDDPRAYVQVRRAAYRTDLVTCGRIKATLHP